MENNRVSSQITYNNVTVVTTENSVEVTQPITRVIEVNTLGPRGPQGLPADTSSLITTSSFNNFTSSYNTGSFTGSFNGDFVGGNLDVNGLSNFNNGIKTKTTRISSSTYTVQSDDYRIGILYSLIGNCNIQLPLISSVPNQEFKFKDEDGNALINNIYIIISGSDTIDGQLTASLNTNYSRISIYNDGNNKWFIE